ncbi:acyltransferase [Roseococcus sp. SYP-B2431]|uniref:acyltransferase family protein n=1 Tax=Roseococcus sp. SYP-B2431 TaxID=2496640 RepID=UPI0013F42AFE|nr:acyltransferase [Roseococcus sp. SYP-B2431]
MARHPDAAIAVTRMPHVGVLDGIRAVAFGLVFLGHAGLGAVLIPGGFGVTLFFFLSGFLITSLLRVERWRSGRVDLKRFYLRRFLRIQPPLWITMAVVFALTAGGLTATPYDPLGVIAQATLWINYAHLFGIADGLPDLPLWSLAVEEHFYLIFPAIFLLSLRQPVQVVAAWCAVACAAALALRLIYVFGFGEVYYTYYWSHTRVDSILFGCILALWQNPVLERHAWRPRPAHVAAALFFLLMTFAYRNEAFRETIRYTIQGLCLFVLFSAVMQTGGPVRAILTSWPLQRIGLYSYTLYLIHMVALALFEFNMPWLGRVGWGVAAALASLAYAAVLYAWVERPLARIRHRMNESEARS